jgi:hypothetical protein
MTRNWPLFAIAAALMSACVVLNGTLAGLTAMGALVTFVLACSRSLGRMFRDDPDRLRPVVREDGFLGLMAEHVQEQRRRQPTPPSPRLARDRQAADQSQARSHAPHEGA